MSTCKFCGNGDVIGLRKLQSPHSKVSYTLYECKKCRQRFFMLEEHEISRSILKKLYDYILCLIGVCLDYVLKVDYAFAMCIYAMIAMEM